MIDPVFPPPRPDEAPLRIMHLSRAAETLRSFLIPTMREQQRLGHDVYICTGDSPDAEYLRQIGYDVAVHGMKRSLNPLGALRAVWRIRRFLRERGIDVVICHNSLAGQVARVGAWLAGTPRVVYFAHGLACGPAQNFWTWNLRYWAERLLAPFTSAIVIMNDYDERISRTGGLVGDPRRVFRISGMGVDLRKFCAEPCPAVREKVCRGLGLELETRQVLCVARLIPEKGVRELLEAARVVCRSRADVVFLLAGTGPLFETLRESVRRHGLERQFRVLGWRNDIADLMQSTDMLVLPSYYMEGLPVSILEAMACAKPVVSTLHKGCEDAVVHGETGFLVPVREIGPLADSILELLRDPALCARMGQAGRRRVERHYELEQCTQTIVDVLERAMR